MKCDEVQSLMIEYLDDNLDEITRQEMENHLSGCESCRKELAEVKTVFDVISRYSMEPPDPTLRENFYTMLHAEQEKLKVTNTIKEIPLHRLLNMKWPSSLLRIAAAVALLIAGTWIGIFIKSGMDNKRAEQLSELKNEMKDMKEMLMFTMLNGESASQRIKAVNYSSEIPYPNQKVISALVSTLNSDKNVNVRLAAAYSLEKFWDNAAVRDSLVASLEKQNEPIIQIVLMNILTEKKETKAIQPMQQIIANKSTMKEVKDIAEKNIRVLM